MAKRTRIDAGIAVVYQNGSHAILRNGVIVLENDRVVHVGKTYDGPADHVIDAKHQLVTPGLINTHTHLSESPLDKSVVEDVGKREFSNSGLADMLPARGAAMDEAARHASIDYSMVEIVRSGTTTVMEMGGYGRYTADAADKVGMRAYIADGYRSGRWYTNNGRTVQYEWDEEAGKEGMKRAIGLIEELDGRSNGRIQGFLSPMQIDTCTEELLRESRVASDDLQVPLALHTSQSVFEFDEIMRRHALTPVEWLDKIDFLSPWNVLGHVIIIAGSSWPQVAGDDLSLLAAKGATVAHSAWVFARRGIVMESFPHYLRAGVNVTLGADSSPQSMIEAMRWAAVLGKATSRQTELSTAKDAFDAATVNAAKMLHRDDLGKIDNGAKADLLFWDLNSLFMVPVRDPIKNLVFNATPSDLRHAMVDGEWIMRDQVVRGFDEAEVSANLQTAGERMWANMHKGHWNSLTADELSPPTYPEFTE